MPSVDALIAHWIAAENTEETQVETLRLLLQAGANSGVSNRSFHEILQDYRERLAAA